VSLGRSGTLAQPYANLTSHATSDALLPRIIAVSCWQPCCLASDAIAENASPAQHRTSCATQLASPAVRPCSSRTLLIRYRYSRPLCGICLATPYNSPGAVQRSPRSRLNCTNCRRGICEFGSLGMCTAVDESAARASERADDPGEHIGRRRGYQQCPGRRAPDGPEREDSDQAAVDL
jgi:hypothetical protein